MFSGCVSVVGEEREKIGDGGGGDGVGEKKHGRKSKIGRNGVGVSIWIRIPDYPMSDPTYMNFFR